MFNKEQVLKKKPTNLLTYRNNIFKIKLLQKSKIIQLELEF